MKIYKANKILVVGIKRYLNNSQYGYPYSNSFPTGLNGRKDHATIDIPHELSVQDVLNYGYDFP